VFYTSEGVKLKYVKYIWFLSDEEQYHIRQIIQGGKLSWFITRDKYVGKTFTVENLRPGSTMLWLVSGQHRYSRKIFNCKTFMVSKNPLKPQKFSPSNDLTYVYSIVKLITTYVGMRFDHLLLILVVDWFPSLCIKLLLELLPLVLGVYFE